MLVPFAAAKTWLQLTDEQEALGTEALTMAQGLVEAVLGHRTLEHKADVTELVDGAGTDTVYVTRYPVTKIAEAKVLRVGLSGFGMTAPAVADIEPDSAGGLVRTDFKVWPFGRKNIRVTYDGGYTTESLPAELKSLILQVAEMLLNSRGKAGYAGETLGDYTYRLVAPTKDQIRALPGAESAIRAHGRTA